jgi:hypothetical protein
MWSAFRDEDMKATEIAKSEQIRSLESAFRIHDRTSFLTGTAGAAAGGAAFGLCARWICSRMMLNAVGT